VSKRESHLEVIWNKAASDYVWDSATIRDVVLVEKAWCIVLLEGYRWCAVGFILCEVQMNVFLKGNLI
jgi:hypothetical protein